jgi:tetratricopeptide (TPR) repeat protein
MKKFVWIICYIMPVFFISCGVTGQVYTVKRPAEVNMKGLKVIAIGDIQGTRKSHSAAIMNELTSRLSESGAFDAILDRNHLDRIIEEHKLTMSGFVDDGSIIKLGKLIGAAAIINGAISVDKYREDITRQLKVQEVTNVSISVTSNKYEQYTNYIRSVSSLTNISYKRTGKYVFSVGFQIVDTQTARLLAAKTISASREKVTEAVNGDPDMIDPEYLFVSSVEEICNNFAARLLPKTDVLYVTFLFDNKITNSEKAINYFKIEKYSEGIALLREQLNNDGTEKLLKAKIYYDVAMGLMLSDQYEEALQNAEKALELNPNDHYIACGPKLITDEWNNAKRLKEQE